MYTFSLNGAWLSLTVVEGYEIVGSIFKKFGKIKGIFMKSCLKQGNKHNKCCKFSDKLIRIITTSWLLKI